MTTSLYDSVLSYSAFLKSDILRHCRMTVMTFWNKKFHGSHAQKSEIPVWGSQFSSRGHIVCFHKTSLVYPPGTSNKKNLPWYIFYVIADWSRVIVWYFPSFWSCRGVLEIMWSAGIKNFLHFNGVTDRWSDMSKIKLLAFHRNFRHSIVHSILPNKHLGDRDDQNQLISNNVTSGVVAHHRCQSSKWSCHPLLTPASRF